MKKKRNSKEDSRQASLFDSMFFESEPLTVAGKIQAEQMPDIEVVLPEPKQPAVKAAAPEPKPAAPTKMLFMSFGSGSSGNCAYLGNEHCGVLIDAGVDAKMVFESLERNGITPEKVKAIILTHDHGDHVRYAYAIVRKHKHIRIYCTLGAKNGMLRRHNITRRIAEYHQVIYRETPFSIADFKITAFDTSHDATDNKGFFIECGDKRFVVATDMGKITERAEYYMKQANYLMLESNYDRTMLDTGTYPEYLKQRIRKDTGHLDNEVAAAFVSQNYDKRLKYLFLCHLSHDNNTPEIALSVMRNALEAKGVTVGDCSNSLETRGCDLQLYALPRYDCSPLFVLTE